MPGVIWMATAAFAALVGSWVFLVPLYGAPDEWGHVDLAVHLAEGGDYPAFDGRRVALGVVRDCVVYSSTTRWCSPPEADGPGGPQRKLRSDAPSWRGGPTFAQRGGGEELGRPNQLLQHPSLYYRLEATVLRFERLVAPGEWSLAREVTLLRLTGAALMAPLPLLAWAAARALRAGERAARLAALLPFTVPQLAHIGGSVNNDVLLILLGSILTWGTARVLAGDRRWATTAILGVTAPLALLTKSSAMFLLPSVGLAHLWCLWRDPAGDGFRDRLRTWGPKLAAIVGSAAVLGGWWYVANKVRHGSFTPWRNATHYDRSKLPAGFRPDPGEWWRQFRILMPARFWGWMANGRGHGVVGASTAAALTFLGAGLFRRSGRGSERGPHPVAVAILFLPALLLLAFVAGRGWNLHTRSGGFPFLQGRYLFPAVAAGAVVGGIGAARLLRSWAIPVVAAWAVAMQLRFAHAAVRDLWGGSTDPFAERFRALLAWSRLPGPFTVLVFLLALVGIVSLAVAMVRGDRLVDSGADESVEQLLGGGGG